MRIGLDPGHGTAGAISGRDTGTAEYAPAEHELNFGVVAVLARQLEAEGHTVFVSRAQDPDFGRVFTPSARGRWAADRDLDVFVSVHHDGNDNPAFGGLHGFYDNEGAPNGKALATQIAMALCGTLGIPYSSYGGGGPACTWPQGHLGVLSGGANWAVTGAACLIECGTMTNAADRAIIRAAGYYTRAAEAIRQGIYTYAGLSPAVVVPPAPPAIVVVPAGFTEYMALYSRGPAVRELQRLLSAIGYRDEAGDPLVMDGDFGPKTLRGVLWAQARLVDLAGNALDQDGIVGPLTYGAIAAQALVGALLPPAADEPVDLGLATVATRSLERALWYIAHDVRERPMGSNRGGPGTGQPADASVNAILGRWFPNEAQPWCAAFVGACCIHAGLAHLPSWPPLVSSWRDWAQKQVTAAMPNGLLMDPATSRPRPGDLFLFGDRHIGFVVSYDPVTGKIVTAEGNFGDAAGTRRITWRGGSITHGVRLSALE